MSNGGVKSTEIRTHVCERESMCIPLAEQLIVFVLHVCMGSSKMYTNRRCRLIADLLCGNLVLADRRELERATCNAIYPGNSSHDLIWRISRHVCRFHEKVLHSL